MTKLPKIQIFQDVAGEFRWRIVAGNGEVVASSGEGFRDKTDVLRAVRRARKLMRFATIEEKS